MSVVQVELNKVKENTNMFDSDRRPYVWSVSTTGDIPLHLTIRETSDKGQPVVVSSPDSPEVIVS